MRKLLATVLACSLILTGCSAATRDATTEEMTATTTEMTETQEETSEITTEATSEEVSEDTQEATSTSEITNLFEAMPSSFVFSSGAGGWSTDMTVNDDGTFSGNYHDSEMGSIGDGYPNGTMYVSSFSGEFSEPVKVDDYTYSMKLESIKTDNTPGEEEIKDDIKYIYSEPSGFDSAKELLIYLPGKAMSDIPEGAKPWIMTYLYDGTPETIPFYVIYNVKDEEAFVGIVEE